MLKKLIRFQFIVLLLACNPASDNSGAGTPPESKEETSGPAEMASTFSLLDQASYDLAKLEHEGKITYKKIWQDTNGENIAIFTQKESELFVYHYSINDDQVKLLRKVYDVEPGCEDDLFIDFVENSIEVTDLDNNNLGELTFAYKKTCTTDVSPRVLKVLLLEDGNKYIMRGYSVVEFGEDQYGGDQTIDPSFENGPPAFLAHAKQVWDKVKTDRY